MFGKIHGRTYGGVLLGRTRTTHRHAGPGRPSRLLFPGHRRRGSSAGRPGTAVRPTTTKTSSEEGSRRRPRPVRKPKVKGGETKAPSPVRRLRAARPLRPGRPPRTPPPSAAPPPANPGHGGAVEAGLQAQGAGRAPGEPPSRPTASRSFLDRSGWSAPSSSGGRAPTVAAWW